MSTTHTSGPAVYINPATGAAAFEPQPGFVRSEEATEFPDAIELHLFDTYAEAYAFTLGVKHAGDENRHGTLAAKVDDYAAVLLVIGNTGAVHNEIDLFDHRAR